MGIRGYKSPSYRGLKVRVKNMTRTKEEIKEEITEKEAEIESLESNDNDKEYEQELNDVYGSVDICGLGYSAGTALKELDEIAFNEGLNNFNDVRITALNQELEALKEELEEVIDGRDL